MSLGDDIVILETTSTEVKNRILKSHELLRAIDTGALYIGGKDGKPQALIASSTTSDGGVKSVGTGLVIAGRDAALSGDAAAAQNTLYNSTAAGRAARRAGGVAVRWTDGTITKTSSNPGESVSLVEINGETFLRCVPSTTPGVTTIIRFDLSKPVYLGNLKTLIAALMYSNMGSDQISSAKFVTWAYVPTGSVRINFTFDKNWPDRLSVESFGRDGFLNVAQPVTDLDLEQVSRIDILFTSGTSSAEKAPFFVGPMVANTRGRGQVIIRLDGQYDSQHKYILPMLESCGLRANLHLVKAQVGQAGRMTEAQLGRAYDWGHDLCHHTFGAKANGWDNVTDYPDSASIVADITGQWAWLTQRGWTRGIGHCCHGFTNTLVPTVSVERQRLVRDAIEAAGVKSISAGGRYLAANAAAGDVGHLFPHTHPWANFKAILGGVMVTNTDTAAFLSKLWDAAEERGETAVVVLHRSVVNSATPAALEMKNSDIATAFEDLGDRIAQGRLANPTSAELFDQFGR